MSKKKRTELNGRGWKEKEKRTPFSQQFYITRGLSQRFPTSVVWGMKSETKLSPYQIIPSRYFVCKKQRVDNTGGERHLDHLDSYVKKWGNGEGEAG